MGYFGIGIFHNKTEQNFGSLCRAAYCFGADFIYTIGKRYQKTCLDTPKSYRHIPIFHYKDWQDFLDHRPFGSVLIGVELSDTARDISNYVHPKQAVYIMGAEDQGLPEDVLSQCNSVIKIPTIQCLNVSQAATIVMYDRQVKKER